MRFTMYDFVSENNRIEGIDRVTDEEVAATSAFTQAAEVTISHLVDLVAVYQPNARPRFVQGLDVRVGSHFPPRGGPHIQHELQRVLLAISSKTLDPYRGHVAYETLHPFTDGNGRTGRALWLWHMGGIDRAPLGFLHHFYYQALQGARLKETV